MSEEPFFLNRLGHIFPAAGLAGFKVQCSGFGTRECAVKFKQDSTHLPHPRNGFYFCDGDASRLTANTATFQSVMGRLPITGELPVGDIEAFVSMANYN